LKNEDVDLTNGRIRILEAKGHKDWLVYLADDLGKLLREYAAAMKTLYACQSDWFFPLRDPEKCLSNGTIGKRLKESWVQTSFAQNCDSDPTVHCLRHSFVVKKDEPVDGGRFIIKRNASIPKQVPGSHKPV